MFVKTCREELEDLFVDFFCYVFIIIIALVTYLKKNKHQYNIYNFRCIHVRAGYQDVLSRIKMEDACGILVFSSHCLCERETPEAHLLRATTAIV